MKADIHYTNFTEAKEVFAPYITEVFEKTKMLCLADTGDGIGLFRKSDIITVYDSDDMPVIVNERIFRSNYSLVEWLKIKRMLKKKLRYVKAELGFEISVSQTINYLDYVHFKEYWWKWANALR